MKVAILINHYTASVFYNDIFLSLGFETYIPTKCGIEALTLNSESLDIRSINTDDEILMLDQFDFYLPSTDSEKQKIVHILESKFDLILTYHPITINKYLIYSSKKIFFIIWGDISGNPFYHYVLNANRVSGETMYDLIIKTREKYFVISHEYLFEKLELNSKFLFLPLGLFKGIGKFYNTRIKTEKLIVVIMISRISMLQKYDYDILYYLNRLFTEFRNVKFHLIGKGNTNLFSQVNNVEFYEFQTTQELYEHLRSCSLSINYSISENVLQFAPIEIACINIPQFYKKNSTIDKLIYTENHFRYDNIDNLVFKLKTYISNPSEFESLAKHNNKIVYDFKSFDQSLSVWKDYFGLNHKIK